MQKHGGPGDLHFAPACLRAWTWFCLPAGMTSAFSTQTKQQIDPTLTHLSRNEVLILVYFFCRRPFFFWRWKNVRIRTYESKMAAGAPDAALAVPGPVVPCPPVLLPGPRPPFPMFPQPPLFPHFPVQFPPQAGFPLQGFPGNCFLSRVVEIDVFKMVNFRTDFEHKTDTAWWKVQTFHANLTRCQPFSVIFLKI